MIYLLRHGETLWNVAGRLQGQGDSPLTWRGLQQARALGECLGREIDDLDGFRLLSSPLGRAWQTAVIVAEVLGWDPQRIALDARLKERDYGRWAGLTYAQVRERYPEDWARRQDTPWDYRVPGGESSADVAARARGWLESLPHEPRLIVVCHGQFGRVLRGLYLGLPREEIYRLEEPQDALFRLHRGRVERIGA
jgi:probable phosphoglycerate mutase